MNVEDNSIVDFFWVHYFNVILFDFVFQIFDLSVNRIGELTKKSFARYPDIKYLYLFENMVKHVEKGTFAHLTNLEVIFSYLTKYTYIFDTNNL